MGCNGAVRKVCTIATVDFSKLKGSDKRGGEEVKNGMTKNHFKECEALKAFEAATRCAKRT
jgi:hypothetical protein